MASLICHLLLIVTSWLLSTAIGVQDEVAENNIVFVIISQLNRYHEEKALILKQNIVHQKELLGYKTHVYLTHKDFSEVTGTWTVFSLLEKFSVLHNSSWTFFCEDITQVDIKKLMNAVSKFDIAKDYFLGYALRDSQPTIIHHYASTDEDSILLYPDTSAGFFISPVLMKKLALRWYENKALEFSIDPKYELAKFVWNGGRGIKLLSVSFLCLHKLSESCATWVDETFPDCGSPVPVEDLYFAVKTCQMFYKDRVTVVKNTWAKDTTSIFFFSETEDPSIPTINIGINNVPSGHCEKTLTIMKYILDKKISPQWVVIADDDTLFSVKRLQKLLSCYDATEDIALGERYGYGVAVGRGYDYITGGGGMVFSMSTVKKLNSFCTCPSIDSPDDMIIGLCLKYLHIPITHSQYFHQARPEDYSSEYLSHQMPVSFHKHWMIDPYAVYKDWLEENTSHELHNMHLEL